MHPYRAPSPGPPPRFYAPRTDWVLMALLSVFGLSLAGLIWIFGDGIGCDYRDDQGRALPVLCGS